jgi:hypothetical protein
MEKNNGNSNSGFILTALIMIWLIALIINLKPNLVHQMAIKPQVLSSFEMTERYTALKQKQWECIQKINKKSTVFPDSVVLWQKTAEHVRQIALKEERKILALLETAAEAEPVVKINNSQKIIKQKG